MRTFSRIMVKKIALPLTILIIVSGCLGSGAVNNPTSDSTQSETMSNSPTSTPLTSTSPTSTQQEETDDKPSQTTNNNDGCDSLSDPEKMSLPDKHENLSGDAVKEYAKSLEKAYVWNTLVSEGHYKLSIGLDEVKVINHTDNGYILTMVVQTGSLVCRGGDKFHADNSFRVNYFINRSVTIRLINPESRSMDPRGKGEIIQ